MLEEADAVGTEETGVGGSLTGVGGVRRTGVGMSSASASNSGLEAGLGAGEDSARRVSSRRKRRSFHCSEGSCARATRQPRYAPQRAHAHSWTVCAPVSISRMEGAAREVLRVDAKSAALPLYPRKPVCARGLC